MNKKTQQIVGALAILGLGYWAYTKYGKKKSFANLTASAPCRFYSGNVGYVGQIITGWNDGHGQRGIVISQNNGQTLICPEGQRSVMPIGSK
jgi:hypothetical protein